MIARRLAGALAEAMDSGSEKLKFGLWGAGVLAVFFLHLAALLEAAVGGEHGALVWSILLLIAAPVSVVGLIGIGFARSAMDDGEPVAGRESESNVDS